MLKPRQGALSSEEVSKASMDIYFVFLNTRDVESQEETLHAREVRLNLKPIPYISCTEIRIHFHHNFDMPVITKNLRYHIIMYWRQYKLNFSHILNLSSNVTHVALEKRSGERFHVTNNFIRSNVVRCLIRPNF